MAEDKWADAHNALTRALDQAKEAGLTKDEVDDAVDDPYTDAPYVPGPPKKAKSSKFRDVHKQRADEPFPKFEVNG